MFSAIKCCNCKYWTGQPGTPNEWTRGRRQPIQSKVLICAVKIQPQPTNVELEQVDGRLAYAEHQCNEFESM